MLDVFFGEPQVDEEHVHEALRITAEEYARIVVRAVREPPTPDINVNDWMDRYSEAPGEIIRGEFERRKQAFLTHLSQFAKEELRNLQHKWKFWSRHNQRAPGGNWTFWWLLAGRGFGKTRTGAEWINERVISGKAKRIALVAPTAADVRKVMVEGESGILAISPPWNRPHFEPSKLQLTWPNGAVAGLFSAEEPERLRGPQCDTFWADELAAWKKLVGTWDMLQFGFRLGDDPRGCITTTPKPLPMIKEAVSEYNKNPDGDIRIVKGDTDDNMANLAPKFYTNIVKRYEGTRLGRQELRAEILEDMPGALWNRTQLDELRIRTDLLMPAIFVPESNMPGAKLVVNNLEMLKRLAAKIVALVPEDLSSLVVSVDPNASNNEKSDEIGITVAGKGVRTGEGYLLADLSMRGSPNEWASTAILAHDVFKADRVVIETNNGGNMAEYTLTSTAKFLKLEKLRGSDFVSIQAVTASRGKVTRAEPTSALYEQNRVHHVGTFPVLEDQMCLFTIDFDRTAMGYSPDRVDSLVWGFTAMFDEQQAGAGIMEYFKQEVMKQNDNKQANAALSADLVKMKAPNNLINMATGMLGDQYNIVDGVAMIRKSDVRALRLAGFVEV